jgi:hypothetical protein
LMTGTKGFSNRSISICTVFIVGFIDSWDP